MFIQLNLRRDADFDQFIFKNNQLKNSSFLPMTDLELLFVLEVTALAIVPQQLALCKNLLSVIISLLVHDEISLSSILYFVTGKANLIGGQTGTFWWTTLKDLLKSVVEICANYQLYRIINLILRLQNRYHIDLSHFIMK